MHSLCMHMLAVILHVCEQSIAFRPVALQDLSNYGLNTGHDQFRGARHSDHYHLTGLLGADSPVSFVSFIGESRAGAKQQGVKR